MSTRTILILLALALALVAAPSILSAKEEAEELDLFKGKALLDKKKMLLTVEWEFDDEEEADDFGSEFSFGGGFTVSHSPDVEDGCMILRGRTDLKEIWFHSYVSVTIVATIQGQNSSGMSIGLFVPKNGDGGYMCIGGFSSFGDSATTNVILDWSDKVYENQGFSGMIRKRSTKPVVSSGDKHTYTTIYAKGSTQFTIDGKSVGTFKDSKKKYNEGRIVIGGFGSTKVAIDSIKVQGLVSPVWLRKARKEKEVKMDAEGSADDLLSSFGSRFQIFTGTTSGESNSKKSAAGSEVLNLVDEAKEKMNSRKYKTALKKLDSAEAKMGETRYAPVYFYQGECHKALGFNDDAEKLYNKALGADSEFYECLRECAEMLSWSSKTVKKALGYADKLVDMRPDDAESYTTRAEIHFSNKDMDKAEADVAKALEIDDNDLAAKGLESMYRNARTGPTGESWKNSYTCETDHYIVSTNIDQKRADYYGNLFERAYKVNYSRVFPMPKGVKWGDKAVMYVFETQAGFQHYCSKAMGDAAYGALGLFHPIYNQMLIFDNFGNDLLTMRVLFHEGFHHYIHHFIDDIPYWLDEGFAEYCGAFDPNSGKVGLIQNGRLRNIKSAIDSSWEFPFDEIMQMTPGQFYSGPVWLHYAQAWSMIHFFIHGERGKYLSYLKKYVAACYKGKSLADAFNSTFGKLGSTKLRTAQEEWKKYVLKLKEE